MAFLLSYVVLVGVLGAVDTLSDYGDPVVGGTDRIINTSEELAYATAPIVFFGAVLLLLHVRDRTCSDDD